MKKISERIFKIWAYTVSHSCLILRSPMKTQDLEDYSESMSYNIDIEFSAVSYMDIPDTIHALTIKQIENQIPNKFGKYMNSGLKVFEIKSLELDEIYYIVAGSYRIGKNYWVAEDRISNMFLEYDEILETS